MSTFIIAEIGINHNGSMDICKKLINIAKDAGCDAVKFQKRTLENVYSKEQLLSSRESPWGKTTYDQKKGLEFGAKEYQKINNHCKKKKIHWFASAWDLDSQKFMNKFNLKFNKIASAMIVDKKFLDFVASQKKHTFISTGMSTMKNISDAVKIFRKKKCSFELMHCVSTYPMSDETANLNLINYLIEKLNISKNKVHNTITKYGNTADASLAITLADAVERKKIKKGDYILISGVGAGFVFGCTILKWF